jgi:hypothetical protein
MQQKTEHEALAMAFVAMSDMLSYLSVPMTLEQKKDAKRKLRMAMDAAEAHFCPDEPAAFYQVVE